MKFTKMKASAGFLLAVTVYVMISNVNGSYENFVCSKDPNVKVFAPCATDCQHNHGGLTGECSGVNRGDLNCYCKGVSKQVYEKSLHCRSQEDKYRKICNVDCVCNHGAKGGYCDWEMKACICRGKNEANLNCHLDNPSEFAQYIYDTIGAEDLGDYGVGFINAAMKFRKED